MKKNFTVLRRSKEKFLAACNGDCPAGARSTLLLPDSGHWALDPGLSFSPSQLAPQYIEERAVLRFDQGHSTIRAFDTYCIASLDWMAFLTVKREDYVFICGVQDDANVGIVGEDDRAVGQRVRADRREHYHTDRWGNDRPASGK